MERVVGKFSWIFWYCYFIFGEANSIRGRLIAFEFVLVSGLYDSCPYIILVLHDSFQN